MAYEEVDIANSGFDPKVTKDIYDMEFNLKEEAKPKQSVSKQE